MTKDQKEVEVGLDDRKTERVMRNGVVRCRGEEIFRAGGRWAPTFERDLSVSISPGKERLGSESLCHHEGAVVDMRKEHPAGGKSRPARKSPLHV